MATTGVTKWRLYDSRVSVTPPAWVNPTVDAVRGQVLVEFSQFERFERPEIAFYDPTHFPNLTFWVARRTEPRIWLVVKGTKSKVSPEEIVIRVTNWPHVWSRVGNAYKVVFNKRVFLFPPDPNYVLPKKIPGAANDLASRKRDVKHALAIRKAFLQKNRRKPAQKQQRYRLPLPPRLKRVNPFVVNESQLQAWEDNGSGYHENVASIEVYRRATTPTNNNTPNFRTLKRHQLPVNNWSCTIVKTHDPIMADLRTGPLPGYYTNSWANTGSYFYKPSSTSHDDSAYNQALKRCIAHAGIGMGGNLAQDFVQWGQTTGLIHDNAKRIADSLIHLRRGQYSLAWKALYESPRFVKGIGFVRGKPIAGFTITPAVERNTQLGKYFEDLRPALKLSGAPSKVPANSPVVKYLSAQQFLRHAPGNSLANNWLALQYGWKPLLMDIHDSLDSLAKYFVQTTGTVRTATGSALTESYSQNGLGTSSAYYQKTGNQYNTYQSRCKVGFRYRIDNKLRAFAAQTGFTNPINLAWEVLPYSFVVDWFLPIGPYFESFSAFEGLEFVDGFVTRFSTLDISAIVSYSGKFPNSYIEGNKWLWSIHGQFSRQIIQFDRQRLTTFPTLTRPSLKNPFSVTHVLNALALLRSAFK